jgi:hypothetical protein
VKDEKRNKTTIIQKESRWEAEDRIFREPYDINFAHISLSHSAET